MGLEEPLDLPGAELEYIPKTNHDAALRIWPCALELLGQELSGDSADVGWRRNTEFSETLFVQGALTDNKNWF